MAGLLLARIERALCSRRLPSPTTACQSASIRPKMLWNLAFCEHVTRITQATSTHVTMITQATSTHVTMITQVASTHARVSKCSPCT